MTLVYIGDDLLDLESNTVIAFTKNAINIGDLRVRNSNYTTRFNVPFTENNIRILGYANNEKSQSSKPYTKQNAKVIQNGVTIIPNGVAIISESSDGFILVIYDDIFDFFDRVGDRQVNDLDTSEYDNYSGGGNELIYPYVNYGENAFDDDPALSMNNYPSFPYKIVLTEIFEQNGYNYEGNVFNNGRLNNMLLSGLGFGGYNEKFTRPKEFEAIGDGTQSVASTDSWQKIEFPILFSGNESGYWNGLDTYLPGDPQGGLYGGSWYLFNVYAEIRVTITDPGAGGPAVRFELFSNTTGSFPTGGAFDTGVSSNVDLVFELSDRTIGGVSGQDGGEVYLRFRNALLGTGLGLNVEVVSARIRVELKKDFNLVTYISAQGLLPQMSQKDFLKDFFIRYAIIPKEDNGTIICKTINEVIRDKQSALDWTQKRDMSTKDKILYEFQNYAQQNYFKYESEDDFTDDETGQGSIDIENENLENQRTFYTSPFASSLTYKFGNETDGYVFAAYIPIIEAAEEENDPGLRLLLKRDAYDWEDTSSEVGYFQDGSAPYSLLWNDFIEENYSDFIESLQKAKFIQRYYHLTEVDIANVNQHRLIYDDGSYYLWSKVYNFVPGKITKVDMLKVV